jgi:hypothetical protein
MCTSDKDWTSTKDPKGFNIFLNLSCNATKFIHKKLRPQIELLQATPEVQYELPGCTKCAEYCT